MMLLPRLSLHFRENVKSRLACSLYIVEEQKTYPFTIILVERKMVRLIYLPMLRFSISQMKLLYVFVRIHLKIIILLILDNSRLLKQLKNYPKQQ